MAPAYDDTGIQYFELKDFTFQNGITLPKVRVAYREFNPTAPKAALIPTCFRGRINTTLNFTKGVLRNHRVIVVAQFGNGESASPSNTENFPSTIDYPDTVRAQHKLITEHLKIPSLDVMVGFSMGGQCTYHWSAMYPEMINNAVIICSSVKTSLHNYQFLEGPKAALINSIDYNDSNARSNGVAVRGLHAFGRAYSAWLTSTEWFEERLFEKQGFKSLQDWSEAVGGTNYEDWHPDNLLAMLGCWQRSNLGAVVGSASRPASVEETLRSLKPRILLMPSQTDQYFRWEASEKEVKNLKNGELAVIPSVWGHLAGGGANPEDNEWMDQRIAKFLNQSA
ncbi:alpha/beta hydrolase fold protein [Aspergillus sclerotialis]|uniref:Alpha/beta hydrolase fold protein n=1 Tax=Aspergillus sclerotialis TaxID=2070753 RepID=A0A3A2ZH22_9EURO|nr:alpha/beta hydrolase fold protein [Aspergillus sclerotialis]